MATKFEISLEGVLNKQKSLTNIQQNISEIENKLNLNVGINADSKSANELKNAINGISDVSKEAVVGTQSLNNAVVKFVEWQVIGDIIHGVQDGISNMIQKVADLDSSLVEFN